MQNIFKLITSVHWLCSAHTFQTNMSLVILRSRVVGDWYKPDSCHSGFIPLDSCRWIHAGWIHAAPDSCHSGFIPPDSCHAGFMPAGFMPLWVHPAGFMPLDSRRLDSCCEFMPLVTHATRIHENSSSPNAPWPTHADRQV